MAARFLTLHGKHWQDPAVTAQFAFACICLIVLLGSLLLAIRPHWTFKGKADKTRKYGVLLAILATIVFDILLALSIALQESDIRVNLLYYLVPIFTSAAWRLSEILQAAFIPKIALEQLSLRGISSGLHNAVKWIAIAFFVVITALHLTGIGLDAALNARVIQSGDPYALYLSSLYESLVRINFTVSLLWIFYSLFLLAIMAAKGMTAITSLTTRLIILAILVMLFLNQLLNTVLNGLIIFPSFLAAIDALSNAVYFITQITLTVLLTLAAVLGSKKLRQNMMTGGFGAGPPVYDYHQTGYDNWRYPQSESRGYAAQNAYEHPSHTSAQYGSAYQPQQSTGEPYQQPVSELKGYTKPHELAGSSTWPVRGY